MDIFMIRNVYMPYETYTITCDRIGDNFFRDFAKYPQIPEKNKNRILYLMYEVS